MRSKNPLQNKARSDSCHKKHCKTQLLPQETLQNKARSDSCHKKHCKTRHEATLATRNAANCESRHPWYAHLDIMVASRYHGSRPSPRKEMAISNHLEVSNSSNHHCHRLGTMTTTTCDSDHEDQDDIMRGNDAPPHLSHPGTENPEDHREFHMVAELSPPADHQPPPPPRKEQ